MPLSLAFINLLLQFLLLQEQHCQRTCASIYVGCLAVKRYSLLSMFFLPTSLDPLSPLTEDILTMKRHLPQMLAYVYFLAPDCLARVVFSLLAKASLKVLIHLRNQYILTADVTLLEYLSTLGLRYNRFLNCFWSQCCILLDASQQFTSSHTSALLIVETDSFNELKVVPIDVRLFGLLRLLFTPSSFLLAGTMKLKYIPTLFKDSFTAFRVIQEQLELLLGHLKNIEVSLYQSDEIGVISGRSSQELKLGVVFFPLAQSHEEVFAIAGSILRSMLNDSLFSLSQALWPLRTIFIRRWFFEFYKYFVEEGFLLGGGFFFDGQLRLNWVLFNFFSLKALQHLFADCCHSVVVIGTVGGSWEEEGKLGLMLFSLHENGLEIGAIDSYVFCCFIQQF